MVGEPARGHQHRGRPGPGAGGARPQGRACLTGRRRGVPSVPSKHSGPEDPPHPMILRPRASRCVRDDRRNGETSVPSVGSRRIMKAFHPFKQERWSNRGKEPGGLAGGEAPRAPAGKAYEEQGEREGCTWTFPGDCSSRPPPSHWPAPPRQAPCRRSWAAPAAGRRAHRPTAPARRILSVCRFCGCGCGVICEVKDGRLVSVTGRPRQRVEPRAQLRQGLLPGEDPVRRGPSDHAARPRRPRPPRARRKACARRRGTRRWTWWPAS